MGGIIACIVDTVSLINDIERQEIKGKDGSVALYQDTWIPAPTACVI